MAALSLALLAGHESALAQVTNGTLLKTFNNPTPAVFDLFGYSMTALGSDRVLIGAYGAGEVYLFDISGTLLTTISNTSPGEGFGSAVAAVGGDRVLIANANFYDMYEGQLHQLGRAYLYTADGTLLNTFTNPSPASVRAFGAGWVAALGSDRVLIGAHQTSAGAFQSGTAYLFSTNGTLLNTITNPTPATQDLFGASVAAVGPDHVIIGSVWRDTGAAEAGAAYLFALAYPPLHIARNGGSVSLSWTTIETGLVLQQTDLLGLPAIWNNTTNLVSVNGPSHVVHQTLEISNRFYRLRYP